MKYTPIKIYFLR